ncbi:CRISPR-associated endonuclease Cas1 [Lachnospiraceae bacterium KHCPX20]|nr:CRISPR-associated endonuclease Cas1 [Lachnospiraceae bacterium KHCPX20]
MSWRTVVISSSAKLDYQMGFLVVRRDDVKKIYLNEIGVLLIESTAVSLTTALLSELMKRKVKVIFCDEKRNPSSELLPYYGSHDTSAKLRNQIAWSEETKKAVWTEIITDKIRKQADHLVVRGRNEEAALLRHYISEIEFADETNREGHAAKVYFNALFGKNFTRTEENSINAALNYGYSIILSMVNREIAYNGYLTQLGLFHGNMFNPFNLGSDLMEPFRPIVDRCVYDMQPEKFEHEQKMEVLKILQKEVRIDNRTELVSRSIGIYCRSVFDALNGQDVSLIKLYYEL